jgi:hypothetical protein
MYVEQTCLARQFAGLRYIMQAVYKLTVTCTQRRYHYSSFIQHISKMLDSGGYEFLFALHYHWHSMPPPWLANTCSSFPCLCKACAGCLTPPEKPHTRLLVAWFHRSSIPSWTLCLQFTSSYTEFSGVAESVVERKRGITLHVQM